MSVAAWSWLLRYLGRTPGEPLAAVARLARVAAAVGPVAVTLTFPVEVRVRVEETVQR